MVKPSRATMLQCLQSGPKLEPRRVSFNALWTSGGHPVELMVKGVDRQALDGLLSPVQDVDVDTWLSAMPPGVVKPIDRAATVDGILAGIPVPSGFKSIRCAPPTTTATFAWLQFVTKSSALESAARAAKCSY